MATAKTPAETTRGQDDERAGDGTAADDKHKNMRTRAKKNCILV